VSTLISANKDRSNDPEENASKGGFKYDADKAPLYRGAISSFPRAITGVAEVSAFGARKYVWDGWRPVSDGINRYSDALVRHLAAEAKGEILDDDSGYLHAKHTAWNALARLELIMIEMEEDVSK